ncbi:MAG: hypothetical protein D6765_16635, partial [Bacteroidetes bacterium]
GGQLSVEGYFRQRAAAELLVEYRVSASDGQNSQTIAQGQALALAGRNTQVYQLSVRPPQIRGVTIELVVTWNGKLLATSVWHPEQQPLPPDQWQLLQRLDTPETRGLLLDQTRSRAGRTFYELFFRQWQAPPQAKHYLLVVEEVRGPNNSAQVVLRVNGREVSRFTLQPQRSYLEQMAAIAAGQLNAILSDYGGFRAQNRF